VSGNVPPAHGFRSLAQFGIPRFAIKVAAPQVRISTDELVERLRLGSVSDGVRDRPRPQPRDVLIELLRNAIVVTALARPLNEPLLRLGRAVTVVENAPDANVVDVADPDTAKLLTLPPVRELIVGKRRVHDSILRFPPSQGKSVVWASVRECPLNDLDRLRG
jgi:hypothetical protein